MELDVLDSEFVEKRQRLVKAWPLVGSLLLLAVVCFSAWLLWRHPLLSNPVKVSASLAANELPTETVAAMAGMLPYTMLMCLMLLVITILFVFAAFTNEKKLLDIIERQTASPPAAEPEPASAPSEEPEPASSPAEEPG